MAERVDLRRDAAAPRFMYRILDADGVLLYVGQSVDVAARVRRHRRKPWGSRIDHTEVHGPFPGRAAAEAAETAATISGRPLFSMSRPQAAVVAAKTPRSAAARRARIASLLNVPASVLLDGVESAA